MAANLKWGILGTGAIARKFANGLAESRTGKLVAIGSRSFDSAKKFTEEYSATIHTSYESLLADPEVEAVYISTPHPMHAEWAIKSADAGKHVLCEKPLTINLKEAEAVIAAAKRNDVFLMEALMYRCHPQTIRLVELIHNKIVGDVKLIRATFSFTADYNLESRLLKNALAGGGILDVGVYCASMARLVAGAATGKPFAEPLEVLGAGHVGAQSRVDEYAVASLKFPGGILAQLTCGVQLAVESNVVIVGTEGTLVIPSPWVITRAAGFSKMIVFKGDIPEEIVVESDRGLYAIEADHVAEYLDQRQSPLVSWEDTLGTIRTLDAWRKSVGVVYDSEK